MKHVARHNSNMNSQTYSTGAVPITEDKEGDGIVATGVDEAKQADPIEAVLSKMRWMWDSAVSNVVFLEEAFKALVGTLVGSALSYLVSSY